MRKLFAIFAAAALAATLASCRWMNAVSPSEKPAETESATQSAEIQTTLTEASQETSAEAEQTSAGAPETEPAPGEFSDGRQSYGADTGTDKTLTGLEPLPVSVLTLPEGRDYSSLSHDTVDFSFGAAADGKPSPQTVANQRFMDERGFGALCCDLSAEDKILYLTFDVGYENGYTIKMLDVLKEKNVPAAFFCTVAEAESNPAAVARMIKDGHVVGNHSVTHPDFSSLTEEGILSELQGFEDYVRENFGYSSHFFRYPQGKYSEYTERILTDLGFTSVFWSIAYADWDIKNQPAPADALQTLTERLHPGAVILLHAVSPTNYEILGDFIDAARAQGYTFVPLTHYND